MIKTEFVIQGGGAIKQGRDTDTDKELPTQVRGVQEVEDEWESKGGTHHDILSSNGMHYSLHKKAPCLLLLVKGMGTD